MERYAAQAGFVIHDQGDSRVALFDIRMTYYVFCGKRADAARFIADDIRLRKANRATVSEQLKKCATVPA
jgi:hypothetical protein